MHNYKELKVWNKSVELATMIYQITNSFPKEEKYGLANQIQRSVVSISSNIAEGAGRNSESEFNVFLGYARGSSFELESQLHIAKNIGYIDDFHFQTISNHLTEIQKMLNGLKKRFNLNSYYSILTT